LVKFDVKYIYSAKKEWIMCGRFTLTVDPSQLEDQFPWAVISNAVTPRYNIAPTQSVAVIPNISEARLDYYRWGLIPSWAKDADIGNRLINARAETLSEKPSFRNALKRRRCLILADGFFEWTPSPDGKSKIPYYIRLLSGDVFAFAGLWDIWKAQDGAQIHSCTIITTSPNSLITPLHNRMPVVLPKESYSPWLSSGELNPLQLKEFLSPYPSEQMEAYPVSLAVNNPNINSPTLISRA
jgi:putative SOS response-associated peptidase YedK